MGVPKLQCTKNYRLFMECPDNRVLVPKKHKRLKASMAKYGWLPCFPLACVRDEAGNLVVLDGQHRLSMAEPLGLPVYYVVLDSAFNIAEVNCTQEKWATREFAEAYAAKGVAVYAQGLEFAHRHGLPIGCAFGLLAGTGSWNNVAAEYYSGQFKITDPEYAETVGVVYSRLVHLAPRIRNNRLLEACIACGRVPDFDAQRLVAGAERCRERLCSYSTRDAYLEMLEEIYNFGRKHLVPLKITAIQTMRERNAAANAAEARLAKRKQPRAAKAA